MARVLGMLKDTHVGSDGGPVVLEHRFANRSDEELRQELAEKAAAAGLKVQGG